MSLAQEQNPEAEPGKLGTSDKRCVSRGLGRAGEKETGDYFDRLDYVEYPRVVLRVVL